MAAPALFREGGADKNKEGGDGFSKTKMLITLKTEVANVRAQIQEEQTKREHMQDWIKDTLKPTLVEMKKEYSDALRDLNSCVLIRCLALPSRLPLLLVFCFFFMDLAFSSHSVQRNCPQRWRK